MLLSDMASVLFYTAHPQSYLRKHDSYTDYFEAANYAPGPDLENDT